MPRTLLSLVPLIVLLTQPVLAGPAGVIYKEYHSTSGQQHIPGRRIYFPVSDPAAVHPFLDPNRPKIPLKSLDDIDLKYAVKAELSLEFWGGHLGSSDQKFRVNEHDWILWPQPVNTPTDPSWYHRVLLGNSAAEIPLEDLQSGTNAFEFTCGPVLDIARAWSHSWIYSFTLRIYYDERKPHPIGVITYPPPNSAVSENPLILVEIDGDPDNIRRVDYLANYEDYDWEGNGLYRQWHYQTRYGALARHVGADTAAPYLKTWNTEWVPDQQHPIALRACITVDDGVVYQTPDIENIMFVRPDRSVRLYKPFDVPEGLGANRVKVNAGTHCKIDVTDEVSLASEARLVLSTWSGTELSKIYLNGTGMNVDIGKTLNYSYDSIPIDQTVLRPGVNQFRAFSTSDYHKGEINWPGPALLVAYPSHSSGALEQLQHSMIQTLHSKVWEIRAYAAHILGRTGQEESLTALLQTAADPEWPVRAAVAEALGKYRDTRAVKALLDLLRSEEPYTRKIWQVRKNAVASLVRIVDQSSVEMLTEALNEEDNLLKTYAAYLLELVQGKDDVPE
jgi:hypothetical protein